MSMAYIRACVTLTVCNSVCEPLTSGQRSLAAAQARVFRVLKCLDLIQKVGLEQRAIKTNHKLTVLNKDWRKEAPDSSHLWLVQAAPEVVQDVISSELKAILGADTLAAYQARYLQQHSRNSLLHLAAAAEAGALLDPSQAAASAQLILDGAPPCLDQAGRQCGEGFHLLCLVQGLRLSQQIS